MEPIKKIVFLDIDGVLNCTKTEQMLGNYLGLDPDLIENFNAIITAHPDAKIVVSSTWRYTFEEGIYTDFDGLKKLLADHGLKGEIIGKTAVRLSPMSRGAEIRHWLESHRGEYDSYVILDDDTRGMAPYGQRYYDNYPEFTKSEDHDEPFADLRPNHVLTHPDDGLDTTSALKAIELLSVKS